MSRALIAVLLSLASGCVEPSQARVTETPEQLLNNDDCAAYVPVKGVMPGAGAPAPKQAGADQPAAAASDTRCSGEPAK
jgi:hypothetical protein